MNKKRGEVYLVPIALANEGYDHLPLIIKNTIQKCLYAWISFRCQRSKNV